MNKMLTHSAVGLFKLLSSGERRGFLSAMKSPASAQNALLRELLKSHTETEYGRIYGLNPRCSREEFRNRVPIVNFDEGALAYWIDRQFRSPSSPILSPGGAEMFEKTSGSSGPHKLIPYNRGLKQSFERYFKIWASDLLSNGPRLESFRIFISISPAFRTEEERSKRVGLDDDSEYLSPFLRLIFKKFLSVPLDLKNEANPVRFRDLLCAHLASDPDLEIISIWHPSFLDSAWQNLRERRNEVADLIVQMNLGKNPDSRERTVSILRSSAALMPSALWPKLKIISSWDSAASSLGARSVSRRFKPALFQGKGLLATEAPMTIPLIGIGSVPFITDVLFEFRDEQGKLHWLDEIQAGKKYSLIISQKGGLLRYDMKDQVCVSSIDGNGLPTLDFQGRAGDCSDLVGEKLTSGYISSIEKDLVEELGETSYCVVPDSGDPSQDRPPFYVVLYDSPIEEARMADWWERRLSASHHYSYSRKVGQLSPVRSRRVPLLSRRLLDHYASSRRMKLGDIKLKNLVSNSSEAEALLRDLL